MASITFTNSGGITAAGTITAPSFSGGTLTGSLTFANSTLNLVGDDCYMGDQDIAGAFCLKGANGQTNLVMIPSSGGTNTKILCDASGGFSVSGSISASSFSATSSRTKKKNISDSNLNAVELLNNVKIVNYVLKDDETETPRIGFIAEDTDSLLSTPDHDHMDMGNCIGVLIKAVQELTDKNNLLEKRIKELEEKLNG